MDALKVRLTVKVRIFCLNFWFLKKGYRFGPPKNLFDTAENQCCSTANDTGINCSVRGIFNVSACKFGTPLAFSWPHFLYGDPKLLDSVEGLRPDPEKHSLFFDIEPVNTKIHFLKSFHHGCISRILESLFDSTCAFS